MRTDSIALTFSREALLYDIANYAYIEAHRRDTPQAHIIADVCADGNRDRIARILGLVHGEVMVILGREAPPAAPAAVTADGLTMPEEYRVMLLRHPAMTEARIRLLSAAIHEYMVASAMAHWLAMLHEAADYWQEEATTAAGAIKALTSGCACSRRRLSPW